MKTTFTLPFVLSALSLLGAAGASAQSFSIDSFTVAGGSGTVSGGAYSINGTVGQSDASPQPLTGGAFSLVAGFWSILAVQTPDAPLLSIERQGEGVRIFWPLPATGFVLDQSLAVTGLWSHVTLSYVTNATDISVSDPTPTGNTFYRLRRP